MELQLYIGDGDSSFSHSEDDGESDDRENNQAGSDDEDSEVNSSDKEESQYVREIREDLERVEAHRFLTTLSRLATEDELQAALDTLTVLEGSVSAYVCQYSVSGVRAAFLLAILPLLEHESMCCHCFWCSKLMLRSDLKMKSLKRPRHGWWTSLSSRARFSLTPKRYVHFVATFVSLHPM